MSRNKKLFIPDFFKNADELFIPEWIEEQSSHGVRDEKFRSAPGEAFCEKPSPQNKPLILKGGKCVIPYQGIFPLDIEIRDGKILSLGERLPAKNATAVDVAGKFIAPGIVDPH